MVLLAIVISSFTGLLGVGKDKLLLSLSFVESTEKATSGDVIAGGDAFSFSRNKNQIVAVSFFNSGFQDCDELSHLMIYCPDIRFDFDWVELPVSVGTEKTLGMIIKIAPSVPRRNYVCSLKVRCGSDYVVRAEQLSIFKVQ